MNRLLKVALVASSSAFCLFYALQNLVNLGAAYGFVQYVTGMIGHEAYPGHFGPAVSSPVLIWAMLVIIIALELAAGIVAGKGAFDLWRVRAADAAGFNAAKTWGLAGCGLAVFIWFGIFSAVGGAYFQMWQTEAGANALQGSFQYAMLNGLVWLIVSRDD